MKRTLALLVLVLFAVAMLFVGCQKGEEEKAAAEGEKEAKGSDLRVVLYLNGTLGDKSFFDSAARGVDMAEEEFGIQAKVIEGGYDPANWEPDLNQLAQGNWDIIIAGTWQLAEFVSNLAQKHPDKRFFTYDTSVDYSKEGQGNVYSILYKQNEGAFLVGALAAMITNSDLPAANGEKVVGFLGGMDIPVINDFKVGYEQGAKYVDSDVKVLTSYVGAFDDPAKGKELVLAQYDQGADIAFNVAGESGLGLLDAAKEKERYAIGVDSDQYQVFKESDPEKAKWIVTSMMKNVDKSIYRGIKLHIEGELEYGKAEALGVKRDGVGVARNERFQELVPDEFKERIDELIKKIEAGEIDVETTIGK